MKLIRFEIKKFLFNWKTLVLIAIFSVLLIGGSLRQELEYNDVQNNPKNLLADKKQQTNYFSMNPDENKKLSKEAQQKLYDRLDLIGKEVTALEAGDSKQYFDLRAQEIKQDLEESPVNKEVKRVLEGKTLPGDKSLGKEELKQELEYIQLVKKRGLDFEYRPEIQVHAFAKLVRNFSILFSNIWLLGFAMILTVSFASIFENKEIRTYQAFGVKKSKLILSKFLSSLGLTYLWLLLLSGILLLSIGLLKGFGSPNYPAYLKENVPLAQIFENFGASSRVVNMAISNGEVIIISLLYGFFILFFLAALGMFLSVLTKRSMVVVAFMAILIDGYSYIQDEPWIQSVRKFIPMSYLNPVDLLKYPNYLFGKSSLYFGFAYLLILGIIFLLASYFTLKKYRLRRI